MVDRYDVSFIYFWDDDTFVSPRHFSRIAKEILSKSLKIKIGMHGIRANEVDRMNDEDIELLKRVKMEFLHIGLENGSQRILDLMQKGITMEQSLSANRKLARHKDIVPMYNILIGVPTETVEDLKETGRFMLRIADENPRSIIHSPNKLIPYPGGEAYEIAIKHGFKKPETASDWLDMDQEGKVNFPWYTPEFNRHTQILQLAAYGLSDYGGYLKNHSLWIQLTYKVLRSIYRPIARFRARTGNAGFLIEFPLLQMTKNLMEILAPANSSKPRDEKPINSLPDDEVGGNDRKTPNAKAFERAGV